MGVEQQGIAMARLYRGQFEGQPVVIGLQKRFRRSAICMASGPRPGWYTG